MAAGVQVEVPAGAALWEGSPSTAALLFPAGLAWPGSLDLISGSCFVSDSICPSL